VFYIVAALMIVDLFLTSNAVLISNALEFILILFGVIVLRQFLSVIRLRFTRVFREEVPDTAGARTLYY
jgi:hypothetical protein